MNPVYWNPDGTNQLSSHTIYSFLSTSQGEMYVGTDVGIDVFSGKRFTNLESDLFLGDISAFVELEENRVVCFNFQGLVFFIDNKKVTRLNYSEKCSFLGKHENDLIGVLNNEIVKIDTSNWSAKVIHPLPKGSVVKKASVFENDIYLFINYPGRKLEMVRFNLTSHKANRIPIHTKADLSFEVQHGKLIIYDRTKPVIYFIDQHKPVDLLNPTIQLPSDGRINHVVRTIDGRILVASTHGLYEYSSDFELMNSYFKDKNILNLVIDQERNLWLSLLGKGIYVVHSLDLKSYNVTECYGTFDLITNTVWCGEQIILGSSNGIIQSINRSGNLLWELNLLNDARVQAMFVEKDANSILVYCGNLYRIDLSSGKLIDKYIVGSTKAIASRNNLIACASSLGLYLVDMDGSIQHYLIDSWIRNLAHISDELLLLETQNGLVEFNLITKDYRLVYTDKIDSPRDLTQIDNSVFFRNKNQIYRYTENGIENYTTHVNNNIKSLGSTGRSLYVVLENGNIIVYEDKAIQTIDAYTGLYDHSSIKLIDAEEHWLSLSDKSIRVLPKNYEPFRIQPLLVVSTISGTFQLNKSKVLTSDFASNRLEVLFHLLPNTSSYTEGKISYRIPGVIEEWTSIESYGDDYLLILERLPSGRHVLEIVAENVFNETSEVAIFQLQIVPPFYLTWWFLTFMVLLLILLIGQIIRSIVAHNKKKGKEMLEREKLKIKAINAELTAIRSQMNPHFIFNSLSSIQTKILSNQSREAYDHLTMFAKLLRSALEYSKNEYLTLEEELNFIRNYIAMEQKRSDDPFKFELSVDHRIVLNKIKIPALILQPFVENAIVHGFSHIKGDRLLLLNVKLTDKGYKIEIIDNGVGRTKSKAYNIQKAEQHKSFATAAVQERIEILRKKGLMNIQIDLVDLTKGTKVLILIENIRNLAE